MEKGIGFDLGKDIPDLAGKVIFITGGPFPLRVNGDMLISGTAGLGKESILALAKHNPEHIYFSGRNSSRAVDVITDIKASIPGANLTFIECDLASLSSVSSVAKQFLSSSQRLDILMCNAGIMAVPAGLTKDSGYEIQFGTNHIGHALLIKLLLPALFHTASLPNADVCIVMLASTGYSLRPSGGIIFNDLRTTQEMMAGRWIRFGQSKLATLIYARSLSKHYPQITSVAVHPGIVATGLLGNLSFWDKVMV
jgi:NAD(P)-dependent dehydrogenase (short-subunit alcohol dehydrogenase family)